MSIQFETWLSADLNQPQSILDLTGSTYTNDANSNLIGVKVYKDGSPVSLTGSISAYAIRPDGATATITGSKEDNKAWIILPAACFAAGSGILTVAIRHIKNDEKTTLAACRIYVSTTTTDTIIDPSHVVPSLDELLVMISTMETDTAAAEAATSSANSAASSANSAASSAASAASAANTAASSASTATSKLENIDAVATNVPNVNGEIGQATASVTTVDGHYRLSLGVPVGVKGDKGDTGNTGAAATITAQYTSYQVGDSGTTEPTGTWQSTIPTVPQGKFLWVKRVLTFNDGTSSIITMPSRQGVDGSGSVSSVNNIAPDNNGNVSLGDLVKSVNSLSPDNNGNVNLGALVKSVNSLSPDNNGNVSLGELVKSVNSLSPDNNGNVSLGELVKSVNNLPPPPGGNGNINLPIDDAPITNSSNPVKSGALKTILDAKADSTDLTATNNALAQTNGAIAIVQTGDNATQTIDAGAFVLWKGVLYTADASIPSGDPFATSGGSKNLTAAPDGGLNALNSITTESSVVELRIGSSTAAVVATGTATHKHCGRHHWVYISFSDCTNINVNATASITGTRYIPSNVAFVPVGIRMSSSGFFLLYGQNTSASLVLRSGYIGDPGNAKWTFGSANAGIYISYSWID